MTARTNLTASARQTEATPAAAVHTPTARIAARGRGRARGAPFVIVGGGVAGASAALTLRGEGYDAGLLLISDECALPYRRAPLSGAYLRGDMDRADLLVTPADVYRSAGIDVLLGARATALDPRSRTVEVRGHGPVYYEHLIIATGGRSNVASDTPEGVVVVRDSADADHLRELAVHARRAVVVGTGYTGIEIASSLAALGLEVVLVGRAPLPLRELGPGVGRWLTERARERGISMYNATEVVAFEGGNRLTAVVAAGGERIPTDLAVLAYGAEPQTALAESGRLAVADGILTDDRAETSDPRIFAAGEVARFLHPVPGDLVRLGHEAVAREMGAVAARSALGATARPLAMPSFTANAFGEQLAVVGYPSLAGGIVEVAAGANVALWTYLRNRRLVGAAGVNADNELSVVADEIEEWTARHPDVAGLAVTPSAVALPTR